MAFASLAFIISQYGIVIASNAVVAGIDLAAVFPGWFTLRRGGYFTILFAFVMPSDRSAALRIRNYWMTVYGAASPAVPRTCSCWTRRAVRRCYTWLVVGFSVARIC